MMSNRIQMYIFIFILFALLYSGCYSIFPVSEVNNGFAQDSKSWKYFNIICNLGDHPKWESYFGLDKMECLDYYVIQINNLDKEDYEGVTGKLEFEYSEFKKARGKYIKIMPHGHCPPYTDYFPPVNIMSLDVEIRNELLNYSGEEKNWIPLNLNESLIPSQWNYFRIQVRTQEDSIFTLLQDDINLFPYLETYTLIVNFADPDRANQYIAIGDEHDPNSMRFSWFQLCKKVQNGLKNWNKANKQNYSKTTGSFR